MTQPGQADRFSLSNHKRLLIWIAVFAVTFSIAAALFIWAPFSSSGTGAVGSKGERIFEVVEEKNIAVPMSDGTILYANVYRPKGSGKFPVVLTRLPYGKDEPGFLTLLARGYARTGYVWVIQDCRGRFASEGQFEPFANEVKDGADTIDWVHQQRWCNGQVGMLGYSYPGYTCFAAAMGAKGKVAAIVPFITSANAYKMIYENGVFNFMMGMDWTASVWGKDNVDTAHIDLFKNVNAPLIKHDDQLNKDNPYYNSWIQHPTPDDFWAPLNLEPQLDTMNTPTLMIGGWYDVFSQSTIDAFTRINEAGGEAAKKTCLIMGPWTHGLREQVGTVDFGAKAKFMGLAKPIRQWFDVVMGGKGSMPFPKVSIYTMNADTWRQENQWPLPDTRYTKFYFHSKGKANSDAGDGFLNTEPPKQESPDKYLFDPKKPVPSAGGNLYPAVFAGAMDQKIVESRKDVLVYTTERLPHPIEVTGPITVTLYASTSALDTDFTVKLAAVNPSGEVINIQDGIIRAWYRHGLDNPQSIKPGEVEEYTINCRSTSYLFLKDQRIRVEISSSNFPRFSVNRNTGADQANDNKYVIAKQTVYHDKLRPSHITLPLIPPEK